jgi:DNA processing protein
VSEYRRLHRSDRAYPQRLAAIHDPPKKLFLRGARDVGVLSEPSVAVVGARSSSAYGAHVARLLGRELAAAGIVVSGLARGVDGEAHRGAVDAGGATVAVLGCGIDRDYPSANRSLAQAIAREGLIVSEYEPGVEPAPWRFPARNRIIAGLCVAVVVVEARRRSGSLITADFALEEGREVLAVPGEITSGLSVGTNQLLRIGATPVTAPEDVFEALGLEQPKRALPAVTPDAGRVLARIRDAPAGVDEVTRWTGLDAGAVAAAFSELELLGLVSEAAGVFRACDAAVIP